MVKQTGLVRYSGTIGGVRHFKIKRLQGDFAGLAGRPSGEQIATDPTFERTHENMNEFILKSDRFSLYRKRCFGRMIRI